MGLNVFKKKPSEARRETKTGIEIFKSVLDKKLYYRDVDNKSVPVSEEVTIDTDASLSGDGTPSDPLSVEGKQDTLVSGTNIKTLNGASVLGSGDLSVGGGSGIHTQMLPGGSFMGGLYTSNKLFGGSNYNLNTYANNVLYVPFIPNNTFTSTTLNFTCLTGSAGDEHRICIYSHDGINMPQTLLYESADIDMSTSGTKTVNVTRNWVKGEVYWFAFCQKTGGANIMGMGGGNADSLIIGLINTNYFTMYRQTNVTYTNGAPTTANPNSNLLDPYLVHLR